MADPVLQFGATGASVMEAQDLLNRNGALILKPDGVFGSGTQGAVREFQAAAGLSAVTGIIDDATWQALRAQPEPSPDIPTRAVTFIATNEVSSRNFYDSQCARPTWPKGLSGVTIGVGYDLGQMQQFFLQDWSDVLSQGQIRALTPWLGRKGMAAQAGPAALANVIIPWEAAWKVFIRRSLPQHVGFTKAAFAGFENLPALCLGVLVDLVYNRGASMKDGAPGDRQEMRDIQAAVAAGNFQQVPASLRSMKRLSPDSPGLRDRRDAEAAMFEEGLAAVQPMAAAKKSAV